MQSVAGGALGGVDTGARDQIVFACLDGRYRWHLAVNSGVEWDLRDGALLKERCVGHGYGRMAVAEPGQQRDRRQQNAQNDSKECGPSSIAPPLPIPSYAKLP
jgi:hypothetical protein